MPGQGPRINHVDQDDERAAQEGPEDDSGHRPRSLFRRVCVLDLSGGVSRRRLHREEKDSDGRMVCAVRADLCIGCGLCVTLGNPTAPQVREFGCPPDYDAINMMPFDMVVKVLEASEKEETTTSAAAARSRARLNL